MYSVYIYIYLVEINSNEVRPPKTRRFIAGVHHAK